MHTSVDLDDYHWLTSHNGQVWLDRVTGSGQPLHRIVAELRRHLSPVRAHLVLEQVELRRRATRKFDQAADMFFTQRGLEQATDGWIAAYKASRFPANTPIADLCCGIGGDLVALAERGPVIGIDNEPRIAVLARANLQRLCGVDAIRSRVEIEHAESFDPAGIAAWHCDPDRRPEGRRTTRVERHAPDPSFLLKKWNPLHSQPPGAIKLAPASNAPQTWSGPIEWEWICRDRECRQLVGWFGDLARHPNQHVATHVYNDQRPACSFVGSPHASAAMCRQIDRYIYAPNPAIFAARLDSAIALEYGLARIGTEDTLPCGYLTGNRPISDPLLDRFEVLAILPLDRKQLAKYIRARKIGQLEIKCRDVPIDPVKLRRQLRCEGDCTATLLAFPVGQRTIAVLAQRCDPG